MINTENTAPAMIAKHRVYARKNQTFLLTFPSLFLRNLIFLILTYKGTKAPRL